MRGPVPLLAAVAIALACGCTSSARYTAPSVAINTLLGIGVAAQQRAEGGCYAVCTNGTTCNPKTGYCEPAPCAGGCREWEVCVETDLTWRCAAGVPTVAAQRPGGGAQPGELAPGVGVSPATGATPSLPPAKATPDAP